MPGKIVFVVEPDASACRSIKDTLQEIGYDVVAVPDVEVAVSLFPQVPADLVLTAQPLPIPESRDDFASFVKRRAPTTIVVGMVSRAHHDLARDALKWGCDDFLSKPVSAELLRIKVRQAVGPARHSPAMEP